MFAFAFRADSTAIVFWFVFVATLTHTYKRFGKVNTYIHLVIFASLGLRPQLLDFHVNKGGGPLPNQKTPKQRASLDRITEILFFFGLC